MNAQPNTLPLEQLRSLYDEIELAILFDWLEIERPEPLRTIDLEQAFYEDEPTAGPVRLLGDSGGDIEEHTLSNAVARLVLSEVQGRLPQWAAVSANGDVELARTYMPTRRAKVRALPRFLFMINWADSGPGFSWPESYHLVWLPGFGRYVVTASQDSPDMHGYTDEAIGHFADEKEPQEGACRGITGWWKGQVDGWDQQRWAYLFDTGEIDAETAEAWAGELWDPDTGEPLP
jgi:hypothetical protein